MINTSNPQLAQLLQPTGRPQFLNTLNDVANRRGTPLPPELTGIQNPAYDPNSHTYRGIEPTGDPGFVRVEGQIIDIYRLWQAVFNNGLTKQVLV